MVSKLNECIIWAKKSALLPIWIHLQYNVQIRAFDMTLSLCSFFSITILITKINGIQREKQWLVMSALCTYLRFLPEVHSGVFFLLKTGRKSFQQKPMLPPFHLPTWHLGSCCTLPIEKSNWRRKGEASKGNKTPYFSAFGGEKTKTSSCGLLSGVCQCSAGT